MINDMSDVSFPKIVIDGKDIVYADGYDPMAASDFLSIICNRLKKHRPDIKVAIKERGYMVVDDLGKKGEVAGATNVILLRDLIHYFVVDYKDGVNELVISFYADVLLNKHLCDEYLKYPDGRKFDVKRDSAKEESAYLLSRKTFSLRRVSGMCVGMSVVDIIRWILGELLLRNIVFIGDIDSNV